MSSLVFYTDKEQAFVATDTLAVDTDGNPFLFTTKAFAVTHLNMLMAGTGAGGFCGKWFLQVNDRLVVRDIEHLNFHATKILQEFWIEYREEHKLDSDFTTTIYHYGFTAASKEMLTFAYRSSNDFVPEQLEHGLAVKPECEIPQNFQLPNDLLNLMVNQRSRQDSVEKENRIFIGGKIQVHHLTEPGISIHTHAEFPDFKKTESEIYLNFER